MLRVTVKDVEELVVYRLEGDLSGQWVDELREVWFNAPTSASRNCEFVDLTGVARIDRAGIHLLSVMNLAGVQFVARAPYTRSLLTEFGASILEEIPGSGNRTIDVSKFTRMRAGFRAG